MMSSKLKQLLPLLIIFNLIYEANTILAIPLKSNAIDYDTNKKYGAEDCRCIKRNPGKSDNPNVINLPTYVGTYCNTWSMNQTDCLVPNPPAKCT